MRSFLDAVLPQDPLSFEDISKMYVEYVIKNAKKVEFFNGECFETSSRVDLFSQKVSAMWSLGASKLEIIEEADTYVVVKDVWEKAEIKSMMKFSL